MAIAMWSHGLEVVLDDGTRVRIPPGRVRVECDLTRAECLGPVPVEGKPLLHWRFRIQVGERIRVHGPFVAPEAGYREPAAPPSPVGVPILFAS